MPAPVVLVAGSRGLLGEGLCQRFLNHDWHVVGCSRSATPLSHERFVCEQADLSDGRAVAELFRRLDGLDLAPSAVVLNAAVFAPEPVLLLEAGRIDSTLAINVKAPLLIVREALKRMRRKGAGRIVALSSIAVSQPDRGAPLYSMSKAALEQLVKVLPYEVGKAAITINAIEVSMIENSGMVGSMTDDTREALLTRLAIQRPCTVDDVWNATEFFTRDASSYVTGQILRLGFVS